MAMQVRHWLGIVAGIAALTSVAACQFPNTSRSYACDVDEDCDPERTCSASGFCVEATDAGTDALPVDGAVDAMSIDADPFAATRAACMAAGYTLEATTGGYYRKVTAGANWTTAHNDCMDDVAGATHLITLSTQTEVDFQKTLNAAWLGWIDRPTEGTWHLLTDESPTISVPSFWGSNRPDGGTAENCAVWKNSNPLGIDDVDCPQAHPYICECDGRPVTKPPT